MDMTSYLLGKKSSGGGSSAPIHIFELNYDTGKLNVTGKEALALASANQNSIFRIYCQPQTGVNLFYDIVAIIDQTTSVSMKAIGFDTLALLSNNNGDDKFEVQQAH